LKLHQQVVKQASDYAEFQGTLLPNSYPTNDILSIVDVVISDYSSVWIDFLQSEKPILFYVPDKDDYVSMRGLYFDELPGPLISECETLCDFVEKATQGREWEFQNKLDDWKKKLAPYEDGHATQRVVEQVFAWNSIYNPKVIEDDSDSRVSLLLYLGGMKNNGITTAALNLLNSLDPNKYDVTAWTFMPGKNTDMSTYRRIPSHVRLLLRQGSHPLTEDRHILMDRYVNDGDINNYVLPDLARDGYRAEWRRNFGDQSFDHIIDFSGYAGYWSLILAQGEARIAHSVWLHNDLESDRLREVDGERPHFTSLTSVFKSYQFYDNLVSVSKSLSEINLRSLSEFAPIQKFKFARNAQDLDNIADALNDRVHSLPEYLTSKFDMTTDLGALRALYAAFSRSQLDVMIDREEALAAAFDQKDDRFTFINAGRLSPEKNHERLIRSFALCHAAEPMCRLIIVGDGPLRSKLESLVTELGLQNDVLFTGQQPQALDFIARSHCFVMSSDYEGQPMVITEALSVGVPVLTVRFGSVADALPVTDGVVVAPTIEDLAAAMLNFAVRSTNIDVKFSADAYNASVMQEFDRALAIES
jgi:glycosyltransferase involved in cell wall biosynthesis